MGQPVTTRLSAPAKYVAPPKTMKPPTNPPAVHVQPSYKLRRTLTLHETAVMTTCHNNWSSQHRFTTHCPLHRDTGPSIRHASNLSRLGRLQRRSNTTRRRRRARALTSEMTASTPQGSGCPEIATPPHPLSPPNLTSPPSPPAACLTGLAADGPDVHRPQWPAQSSPVQTDSKTKDQDPKNDGVPQESVCVASVEPGLTPRCSLPNKRTTRFSP